MSCRATRDWLHRDVASLEEAQRLLLDDHLTACNDCRGDRDRLRLVREVGTSLPVPPAGARIYQRAIARALLEGSPTSAPPMSGLGTGWRWWLVPVGFAAAATIVIIVMVTRGDDTHREQVAPAPAPTPTSPAPAPVPSPASTDVVSDGVLLDGSRELRAGDTIPTNRPLRTTTDARVKLASLDVAIAPQSQLSWRGDHVVLDQGKVEIQASSTARVITERFEVALTGQVTVEPARVRVDSGSARVSDRAGKQLAQIEAGGEWQPRAPKAKVPAAETMTRARAQLAEKDFAAAEKTAKAVLARSPSRAEEVDALMFLADLAQAMGELDVAVARYEGVATKFADLPAAESALFAAARIEARRGRDGAARVLFDRYLNRYPNGRYADDVRRQRRH